jgi:transposase
VKIHALADAKGRLIAILLTGGQAHDCPAAERLKVEVAFAMTGTRWNGPKFFGLRDKPSKGSSL